MPQLDISTYSSQLFWLAITFVSLLVIIWRSAVPRISDALETRQRRIDDNTSKANEFKKEAEAAIEAYEQVLANARADAQSRIAQAHAMLAVEALKREEALASALNTRVAVAEAAIAKTMTEALDSLREVAVAVATAATERLIGKAPPNSSISAAVDNAIKVRG
jgi:F-type H+-transporting ATPase subunit b